MSEQAVDTSKTTDKLKAFSGNIREYFQQESFFIDKDFVGSVEDFIDATTMDNYKQRAMELSIRLSNFYTTQSEGLKKKPPQSTNENSNRETRRMRRELRNAYRQEIRNGVTAIIEIEDFWKATPDLTPEGLLEHIFEEKDKRFTPRADLTNEQAYLLFAAGLEHIFDRKVLSLAKAKYGNDTAAVAKDLYGIETLDEPQMARLIWGEQIGLALILGKQDSKKVDLGYNYGGCYLSHNASLNYQLMVVDYDRSLDRTSLQRILNHEYDHLFFFRYRTIKDGFKEKPDVAETRKRLIRNPFSMELILGGGNYHELKMLIGTELSAFSLEKRVFQSNRSVDIETQLNPKPQEKQDEAEDQGPIIPGFFKPAVDLGSEWQRLIVPICQEKIYLQFYHAMDMCNQAMAHGLPARDVSVAVAILGPDKIDHLQSLDPYLQTKRYFVEPIRRVNFRIGKIEKTDDSVPFLWEYCRKYDVNFQGFAGKIEAAFPDIKKRMSRFWAQVKFNAAYKPKIEALKKYPLTPEQFEESYQGKPDDIAETTIDTSSFKTMVLSLAKVSFPQFSAKFFDDVAAADTPFHPVFSAEAGGQFSKESWSSNIAFMVRGIIEKGADELERACPKILVLVENSKNKGVFNLGGNLYWETQVVPAAWALSRYPQDKEIIEQTVQVLFREARNTNHGVELNLDGKKVFEPAYWRAMYLGFFYEYRKTRLNNQTSEEQKQTEIKALLDKYANFTPNGNVS